MAYVRVPVSSINFSCGVKVYSLTTFGVAALVRSERSFFLVKITLPTQNKRLKGANLIDCFNCGRKGILKFPCKIFVLFLNY